MPVIMPRRVQPMPSPIALNWKYTSSGSRPRKRQKSHWPPRRTTSGSRVTTRISRLGLVSPNHVAIPPSSRTTDSAVARTGPTSPARPAPMRRAVKVWQATSTAFRLIDSAANSSDDRPTAASAGPPRRPTISVSTTPMRVCESWPSTSGTASAESVAARRRRDMAP